MLIEMHMDVAFTECQSTHIAWAFRRHAITNNDSRNSCYHYYRYISILACGISAPQASNELAKSQIGFAKRKVAAF